MIKQNTAAFIHPKKLKQLLMRAKLIMYFNRSIVGLYQNIQKSLGKSSCSIINSVVDVNINISKYKPLNGSSYIKLTKNLEYPTKGLINIQNINNNECLKWCLVRYVRPGDHDLAKIRKYDQDFARELDSKDITFSVKIRDWKNWKKKNCIGIRLFGYENKVKYPIYV